MVALLAGDLRVVAFVVRVRVDGAFVAVVLAAVVLGAVVLAVVFAVALAGAALAGAGLVSLGAGAAPRTMSLKPLGG